MANKVSFIIQLKDQFGRTASKVRRQFDKIKTSADKAKRSVADFVKKSQRSLGDLSRKASISGAAMTAALTVPIGLMANELVRLGSDAVETGNKFNQVFDTVEVKANKVARTFAKEFGVAQTTAKKMIGDTGDLLVGFGFTGDAALNMSRQVNELASDLVSFQNFEGGAEGASIALTKALLGESEAAKALGIVVRQGTPEFKKNIKRIQRSRQVTLLQAKAIEILRIAQSQSRKAIGDVNRTWNDYAQVQRRAEERTKSTKEAFGKLLLPAALQLQKVIISINNGLLKMSPQMKKFVLVLAGLVAIGGPLLLIIGGITAMYAVMSLPVLAVSAAVMGLVAAGALLAASWKGVIGGLRAIWQSFSDFIHSLIDSYIAGWKALWSGDFIGLIKNAVNIGIALINRLLTPFDFLVSLLGGDAGTLKINPLQTAPSAPTQGVSGTLNGQITVAAEPGSKVTKTTSRARGAALNVGMNMVTQ